MHLFPDAHQLPGLGRPIYCTTWCSTFFSAHHESIGTSPFISPIVLRPDYTCTCCCSLQAAGSRPHRSLVNGQACLDKASLADPTGLPFLGRVTEPLQRVLGGFIGWCSHFGVNPAFPRLPLSMTFFSRCQDVKQVWEALGRASTLIHRGFLQNW